MIPANIREAMELIKGGRCNDDDAFLEVAVFAVPILERLVQTIESRQKAVNEHIDLANASTCGSMARAYADHANRLEEEIYTLQFVLNGDA